MKTKFTGVRIQDKVLEQHISTSLGKISARAKGDINIASARIGINIQKIFDVMSADVAILIGQVKQALMPRLQELSQALDAMHIQNVRERINKRMEELDPIKRSALIDRERMEPLSYAWKWHWIPLLSLILIMTLDTIMNATALQAVAPNLLASVLLSIFMVGAFSVLAHTVGQRLHFCKTKRAKVFTLVIGSLGAFMLFYFLGVIREEYYQQLHRESVMNQPFVWAIWNTIYFLVAVFISYAFLPTQEQWDERNEYKQHDKRYREAVKEKAALEEKLAKAEKEYADMVLTQGAWTLYERDLIDGIHKQQEAIKAGCLKEYHFKTGTNSPAHSNHEHIEY